MNEPQTLEEALVLIEGLKIEVAGLQKDKIELQRIVRETFGEGS